MKKAASLTLAFTACAQSKMYDVDWIQRPQKSAPPSSKCKAKGKRELWLTLERWAPLKQLLYCPKTMIGQASQRQTSKPFKKKKKKRGILDEVKPGLDDSISSDSLQTCHKIINARSRKKKKILKQINAVSATTNAWSNHIIVTTTNQTTKPQHKL